MVTKETSWVNSLLFPVPEPSYRMAEEFFFWIPRIEPTVHKLDKYGGMPAMLLPYPQSRLLILYSHGNGCDIGQLRPELGELREKLKMNILAYEYSGYGATKERETPSESKCLRDIVLAYDFVINEMKWPEENVIIFGRSLGTGPSVDLCLKIQVSRNLVNSKIVSSPSSEEALESNNEKQTTTVTHIPPLLILQSPYLCFRKMVAEVGKQIVGPLGKAASYFFSNRFENEDKIDKLKCPIYFIHGMKDRLIPYQHTEELFKLSTTLKKDYYIASEADHNTWDMYTLYDKIQTAIDTMIDKSKLKPIPENMDHIMQAIVDKRKDLPVPKLHSAEPFTGLPILNREEVSLNLLRSLSAEHILDENEATKEGNSSEKTEKSHHSESPKESNQSNNS